MTHAHNYFSTDMVALLHHDCNGLPGISSLRVGKATCTLPRLVGFNAPEARSPTPTSRLYGDHTHSGVLRREYGHKTCRQVSRAGICD